MKMIIIYSALLTFLIGVISYKFGFYQGQKSRSVVIKYGDIQIKLPEFLEKAGINPTEEQILKLNRELNHKELGFKP